jgi:hypothetical protein
MSEKVVNFKSDTERELILCFRPKFIAIFKNKATNNYELWSYNEIIYSNSNYNFIKYKYDELRQIGNFKN